MPSTFVDKPFNEPGIVLIDFEILSKFIFVLFILFLISYISVDKTSVLSAETAILLRISSLITELPAILHLTISRNLASLLLNAISANPSSYNSSAKTSFTNNSIGTIFICYFPLPNRPLSSKHIPKYKILIK